MESYLREIYDRLIAIGMPERNARGAIEFVWQTLRERMDAGLDEATAIQQHRRNDLRGILAGARNQTVAIRSMQTPLDREPSHRPERARSQPSPRRSRESELMATIESMTQLELQLIARENPGGYIATPRQAAQSRVVPLIQQYYTPSAEGVARMTPYIGEIIDAIEAIGGRDVFSNEELSGGQRALSGSLAILGLIPIAGRVFRSLTRGSRTVVRRLRAIARRLSVAPDILRAQIGRFARFRGRLQMLERVLRAFERGARVHSRHVAVLREFFEELLRFARLGVERSLQAVRRLGQRVGRFSSRVRQSTVQIIDHGGQLRIFRCSG